MATKKMKAVPTTVIDEGHARTAQEHYLLRDFRRLSSEHRAIMAATAAALVVDRKPTLKLVVGGA